MQTGTRQMRNFDMIELNLKSILICSNLNRVGILCLLKNSPNHEMQAEKIASSLGISHRTVLYHLDILQDYEVVEVRRFRKKGSRLLRSVWGLSSKNKNNLNRIFTRIKKKFGSYEFEELINSMKNGVNGEKS